MTGLLLNHSDDLGLPQGYVSGAVAKGLYGIEAPPIDAAFAAADIVFVTVADTVYAGVTPVAEDIGIIRGAVVSNNLIVIATDRELILAAADAAPIERSQITADQKLTRIGLIGSRVFVETSGGIYELDINRMSLSTPETTITGISWSEPTPLDDEQINRIGSASVAKVVSWERIVSDLHSGRILPGVGRYIFDITALSLLYLCFSGVLLWFRKR